MNEPSLLNLEEEMGSNPLILCHQNISAWDIAEVRLVENGTFEDEKKISEALEQGFQVMTIAFTRQHGNIGGETAHRLVTVLVKKKVASVS